jgi:hypothetical protein
MKNEEDDITDELKNYMSSHSIKTGIAGGYLVELKSYQSTKLNKDKIPPEILSMATEHKPAEKISVKKFKTSKKSKQEEKNNE